MKLLLFFLFSSVLLKNDRVAEVSMRIHRSYTIDSLGACQGVSYQNGRVFLYGDREIGMVREYEIKKDSLVYKGREYKLTVDGQDVINHPTGVAWQPGAPTFIGNSIRLNEEGTLWRAVIYHVDWQGLLKTGTLDGNLISAIEDDTCIQGTRPEYVRYRNKWYVATADYGPVRNEVRLYDPQRLKEVKKTSEAGVLVKKFSCTPWVQNIFWIAEDGILVLIQNQVEGRKWRFTYLDLEKSIEKGTQEVIKVIDLDPADELEGFTLLNSKSQGIAVSSSGRNNVSMLNLKW